jgi:hypothetical protein
LVTDLEGAIAGSVVDSENLDFKVFRTLAGIRERMLSIVRSALYATTKTSRRGFF